MKYLIGLVGAVGLAVALSGCKTSGDLRYGDNLIRDTEQWHVAGASEQKERAFLKTAQPYEGYYTIFARYIRAGADNQNWQSLPKSLTDNLGTTIKQSIICKSDGLTVEKIARIADKDRAGLLMALDRNLTESELKDFQAFKDAGVLAHFFSLKDPAKSTRECLISQDTRMLNGLKPWNRANSVTLSIGIGHKKADVSNIGNRLEDVAGLANVVKGAVNPGSLVFNASGLLDVTKVGNKLDKFYEDEANYFNVEGARYDFKLALYSVTPWTRQFIPIYYIEDERKPETRKVVGVVQFLFAVLPTRANVNIQANGYPDFTFINDSVFDELKVNTVYRFGDDNDASLSQYAATHVKNVVEQWTKDYKNETSVTGFNKACNAFVEVTGSKFGLASIDKAAALDRVLSRHPKFMEAIPPANLKTVFGVMSPSKKRRMIETEIKKADAYIAKVRAVRSLHTATCVQAANKGELFAKLKLPIVKQITTVSEGLRSVLAAKSALEIELGKLSGTSIGRAENLFAHGLKGRFLRHRPDTTRRQSNEDLATIFSDSVKVRIVAKGWDDPAYANTRDRSIDELRDDLKPLWAWHLGCILGGGNNVLRRFFDSDIDFAAIYVDQTPSPGNNGVMIFAAEVTDESNPQDRKIKRLEIDTLDLGDLNALDGEFEPTGSACRANRVIETAIKRVTPPGS